MPATRAKCKCSGEMGRQMQMQNANWACPLFCKMQKGVRRTFRGGFRPHRQAKKCTNREMQMQNAQADVQMQMQHTKANRECKCKMQNVHTNTMEMQMGLQSANARSPMPKGECNDKMQMHRNANGHAQCKGPNASAQCQMQMHNAKCGEQTSRNSKRVEKSPNPQVPSDPEAVR